MSENRGEEGKKSQENSQITDDFIDETSSEKIEPIPTHISNIITDTLITRSSAKPEEANESKNEDKNVEKKDNENENSFEPLKLLNSPRQTSKEGARSRHSSQVSFNLPPDIDGKPLPEQIDDFVSRPKHAVSPTLSPANEAAEEGNSRKAPVRTSFDAIPFSQQADDDRANDDKGDDGEAEYRKMKEIKHNITPANQSTPNLSKEISQDTIGDSHLTAKPEPFHPVSRSGSDEEEDPVPVPMTEDRVPSPPAELTQTKKSTFEPISFSDDDNANPYLQDREVNVEEDIPEYSSSGSMFGSVPASKSNSKEQMMEENNDNYSNNNNQDKNMDSNQYQKQSSRSSSRNNSNRNSNNYNSGFNRVKSNDSLTRKSNDDGNNENRNTGRDNPSQQSSTRRSYNYTQKKENTSNSQKKDSPPKEVTRLPLEELSCQSREAEEAIESFSKTGRLPPADKRRKFSSRLEKDKITALENEDYDRVYDLEILSQKANEKMSAQDSQNYRKEQIQITEEKLEQANSEYKEFKKQWNEKMKETEDSCQERIKQVIEQQEAELEDFDAQWNDENYLRKFSKPSPLLLQLKAQERSMVLAKLYDRAKDIRRRSAQIEAEDTRNAQSRAMHEMIIQKKNLTKKQDYELELIHKKCLEQLDIAKRQRAVEEKPYLNRIKKLQNQLEYLQNTDPAQNKQTIMIQTGQFTGAKAQERDLPSVRATSRLIIARKEGSFAPKLNIKPLGQVTTARERKQRTIRVKTASSLK